MEIEEIRLRIKDLPFEVLSDGKFSNYDEFATLIQNKIKVEFVEIKKELNI